MMLSTLIFVLTHSQRIVPAQGVKGSFKWAPLENQPTNYKVRALPQKYTSSMPYNPTSYIPNQLPLRQGKSRRGICLSSDKSKRGLYRIAQYRPRKYANLLFRQRYWLPVQPAAFIYGR